MGVCQDHWTKLREKIDEVGLGALVAETAEDAMRSTVRELSEGPSVDSYNPLMSAYFAILANGGDMVKRAGGSPLYVISDGDEDPMGPQLVHYDPKFQLKYAGKTWPRCVICYLNIVHEMTCRGCDLPQENGFDWLVDRAAEGEVERWKGMNT